MSVSGRKSPTALISTTRSKGVRESSGPGCTHLQEILAESEGLLTAASFRNSARDALRGGGGLRARVCPATWEARRRLRGRASPGRMESADSARGQGGLPRFLLPLRTKSRAKATWTGARVQEKDLRQWGLTGQLLRANFRPARQVTLKGPGPRATNGAGHREWTDLWALFLRTTWSGLPSCLCGGG